MKPGLAGSLAGWRFLRWRDALLLQRATNQPTNRPSYHEATTDRYHGNRAAEAEWAASLGLVATGRDALKEKSQWLLSVLLFCIRTSRRRRWFKYIRASSFILSIYNSTALKLRSLSRVRVRVHVHCWRIHHYRHSISPVSCFASLSLSQWMPFLPERMDEQFLQQ